MCMEIAKNIYHFITLMQGSDPVYFVQIRILNTGYGNTGLLNVWIRIIVLRRIPKLINTVYKKKIEARWCQNILERCQCMVTPWTLYTV